MQWEAHQMEVGADLEERVKQWQQSIQPHLEAQDRQPAFDIQEYGDRIVQTMQSEVRPQGLLMHALSFHMTQGILHPAFGRVAPPEISSALKMETKVIVWLRCGGSAKSEWGLPRYGQMLQGLSALSVFGQRISFLSLNLEVLYPVLREAPHMPSLPSLKHWRLRIQGSLKFLCELFKAKQDSASRLIGCAGCRTRVDVVWDGGKAWRKVGDHASICINVAAHQRRDYPGLEIVRLMSSHVLLLLLLLVLGSC